MSNNVHAVIPPRPPSPLRSRSPLPSPSRSTESDLFGASQSSDKIAEMSITIYDGQKKEIPICKLPHLSYIDKDRAWLFFLPGCRTSYSQIGLGDKIGLADVERLENRVKKAYYAYHHLTQSRQEKLTLTHLAETFQRLDKLPENQNFFSWTRPKLLNVKKKLIIVDKCFAGGGITSLLNVNCVEIQDPKPPLNGGNAHREISFGSSVRNSDGTTIRIGVKYINETDIEDSFRSYHTQFIHHISTAKSDEEKIAAIIFFISRLDASKFFRDARIGVRRTNTLYWSLLLNKLLVENGISPSILKDTTRIAYKILMPVSSAITGESISPSTSSEVDKKASVKILEVKELEQRLKTIIAKVKEGQEFAWSIIRRDDDQFQAIGALPRPAWV